MVAVVASDSVAAVVEVASVASVAAVAAGRVAVIASGFGSGEAGKRWG
jgi:hypothetical protein